MSSAEVTVERFYKLFSVRFGGKVFNRDSKFCSSTDYILLVPEV
jgi:hypothetical protein